MARIPKTVGGLAPPNRLNCPTHGCEYLALGGGRIICPECSPDFIAGNPNRRERRRSFKNFRRVTGRLK